MVHWGDRHIQSGERIVEETKQRKKKLDKCFPPNVTESQSLISCWPSAQSLLLGFTRNMVSVDLNEQSKLLKTVDIIFKAFVSHNACAWWLSHKMININARRPFKINVMLILLYYPQRHSYNLRRDPTSTKTSIRPSNNKCLLVQQSLCYFCFYHFYYSSSPLYESAKHPWQRLCNARNIGIFSLFASPLYFFIPATWVNDDVDDYYDRY